ncbi:MAG: GC-type dockerin domain-anchored protein [Phycisphaerales bacterium]|jgi:hypothetical protein
MTRPNRYYIITLAIAGASTLASAQDDLRVLTWDDARARACGDQTFSLLGDTVHTDLRDALLNPAAFGPGGVVGRSIVLTGTPELTEAALREADVVIMPRFDSLNACEQRLLRLFLDQGGGVLIFENGSPDTMAEVVPTGGATSCGSNAFAFTGAHPVVDGPFGALSGPWQRVFNCAMDDLGAGATPLATIGTGAATAAAFERGEGRAVLVGDEEWAMSIDPCPAAPAWNANGRVFALNAVAWVAPDEGFAFDPPPFVCQADLDGNCLLELFDFLAFQNLFDAGDPAADFDGDGSLTIFDFLAFQNAFDMGCP